MTKRARRWILSITALLVALAVAGKVGFEVAIGRPGASPEDPSRLSPRARELVEAAVAPFRANPAFDHHVHLVGTGENGSGARVNPRLESWLHPWQHLQYHAYLRAFGVEDPVRAESQSVARLARLARAAGVSRYGVLAFDGCFGADGREHVEETEFLVPNDVALRAAAEHPSLFVPVASIHPYRADAVAELERCARLGVKTLKWLPNAMAMDPADPRCDPFYEAMARLGVALLSHAGEEKAVESETTQEFGNPLRLRRALDRGVRVYVAHCASLGESLDLDDPAQPRVPSFELFLRLMDDPRYVGRVWGEISALTQVGRCGRPLVTMLERTDLHERLVSGSDWPLPAIVVMFQTGVLRDAGHLTAEEAEALDEVYELNPLLFDFVLKRTVRHPITDTRFPESVFRAR
jgi:predicted TIM-barrel fold metal-dependent hydrolase